MATPRKQFGQHWLKSEKALAKILATAQLQPTQSVLEIGPGTGILTAKILPQVRSLVAVEIDRDLCDRLTQRFKQASNFTLLQADILALPLASLPHAPDRVVANIPYNITAPILAKLLGSIAQPVTQFNRIVLLVQKEIAQRLTAKPNHKAHSALSVRSRFLAECEFICDVPATAFYPVPKVDSAVVCLSPRQFPLSPQNPKFLDKLINMGYLMRRKMLRNNLEPICDRAQLTDILTNMGIDGQVRAEDLSLEQWIQLSDLLSEHLIVT
ncbi:MAG: 16S rRNA (adenine(1518)-N(6)/adenine(1519)-N(6))-dimethyltransferase RsmA [Pseudanabaenaceae cyanobacterium bins.68]|nr:16S rRNA (adenine(1518)-N(6)/adenine(1519)-N(6))-dimethyltransferase RsmA [Pseudanabaenaceae cyanobacterium bins.68]